MQELSDTPVLLTKKILAMYPDVSETVTTAMANVPRHAFCREASPDDIARAYDDGIIPIPGNGEHVASLSQPSCVALQLNALAVEPGHRVLEVGAGSGYAAAVLAELAGDDALVTTLEIDPVLAGKARDNLQFIGKPGVNVIEVDASACPPELVGVQFDRVLFSTGVYVPPEWIARSLRSEGMAIIPLIMLATSPGWPCFLAKLQQTADGLHGNLLPVLQSWQPLMHTPQADEPAPVTWDANELWELLRSFLGGTGFHLYLLGLIEGACLSGKVRTAAECRAWLDAECWHEIWDGWSNKGFPGLESFALCMTDGPESEHLPGKQPLWRRTADDWALSLLV
ncbi:MAG: protein-L-isoaspartate O-methyltransferase family protein [Armatimonadota bacterium]